jgi:hypothetical protein
MRLDSSQNQSAIQTFRNLLNISSAKQELVSSRCKLNTTSNFMRNKIDMKSQVREVDNALETGRAKSRKNKKETGKFIFKMTSQLMNAGTPESPSLSSNHLLLRPRVPSGLE